MSVDKARIETALKAFTDPYLGTDVVSAGMLKEVTVDAAGVTLNLEAGFPLKRYGDSR
jgi:ATP-binding protein involved in chromosome partitioning